MIGPNFSEESKLVKPGDEQMHDPTDYAIEVDNLSKLYKLYPGQRARIIEWITFGKRKYHYPFWALKDVSIKLPRGQALGIIGPNGSGKSTLLKLVAGTSHATTGSIKVNGSVAALLELGAGFHGEFTGRQNIRMNAQIFGLNDREIDDIMDDIVEFAELDRFIDMPVKTYSSGMYARLGFAVASHLDPDILIVDEALSVGDSYFQRKSLDRIIYFREIGKTILFVSHILPVVQRFCDQVLWLDEGQVRELDSAERVIRNYDIWTLKRQEKQLGRRMAGTKMSSARKRQYRVLDESWGSGEAKIIKVEMFGEDGTQRWHFNMHERNVTIRFHYYAYEQIETPIFGINFHRLDGIYIFGTSNYHIEPKELEPFEGLGYVDYVIDRMYLHKGQYFLSVGLYPEPDIPYWKNPLDWHNQMYEFTVLSEQEAHGIVPFQGNWKQKNWKDSEEESGVPSSYEFTEKLTHFWLQHGWWDFEDVDEFRFAWTKEEAHCLILQTPDCECLEVELMSGKPDIVDDGPVNVLLFIDGEVSDSCTLKDNSWHTSRFKMPATNRSVVRHLKFLSTPSWSPQDFGAPSDDREIGIGVRKIACVDGANK